MGRAPCCDKANVKKGPWSPEEDAKLKDFIEKYGTGGNWIALPQKVGLKRCGKSCRLRWLNYLRPNIKHGEFSDDEDRIICTLYASIGSRWSIIAAQLPGRTDNDIKNYWNTKLKKKLFGLIQPNQVVNTSTFSSTLQTQITQSQSLPMLSQLYKDFSSFYAPVNRSIAGVESISTIPQNLIYQNNTTNYYQYSDYEQNQDQGFVDLKSYHPLQENMLAFGGTHDQASSSSDGSCGHVGKLAVKQEDLGFVNQGYSRFDHQETHQNFILGDPFYTFNDEKGNGILGNHSSQLQYESIEEVKQLISIGNGGLNYGENKKEDNDDENDDNKGMFQYYY